MPYELPRYTIRIPKHLLEKLKYIAEYNSRSGNKEIEFLVRRHVAEFEKQHGTIQTTNKTDE